VQGSFRKVLLVIIDGLRPDAITSEAMPVLRSILGTGWRAPRAFSVRPSVTVAALTSIATGVAPSVHCLTEPSLRRLPRFRGLRPLPSELSKGGIETTVVAGGLSGALRWAAAALLRLAGVTRLVSPSASPAGLVETAVQRLREHPEREFVVLYVNDTDLAGHAWGWMSPAYFRAAGVVDQALARIVPILDEPETLIIITADHGGGGVLANDHDHPHPVNDAIPLAVMGRGIPAAVGSEPVQLLDIPPTVLFGFGRPTPPGYQGRVMHEAFQREPVLV